MAIQDTATLRRSALVGNLIIGNRAKTHETYRVRIPIWLADELRALPPVNAEFFFWDGRVKVTSLVEMVPHHFHHYFITTTLATGTSVEDVSKMVGTSPAEIRKTYEHWIREATDRLDDVQRQAWIKQGLDADGNPKKTAIQ